MYPFEYTALALRNFLVRLCSVFARVVGWVAIGDPGRGPSWSEPGADDLVNDPRFNWNPNNKHYAFKLTDPTYSWVPGNIHKSDH